MPHFSIPTNASALDILQALDNWAKPSVDLTKSNVDNHKNGSESSLLWNVLTALRGPDSDDIDVKLGTTAHIRGAALPHLAAAGGAIVDVPKSVEQVTDKLRMLTNYGTWIHFDNHIRFAAVALLKNRITVETTSRPFVVVQNAAPVAPWYIRPTQ